MSNDLKAIRPQARNVNTPRPLISTAAEQIIDDAKRRRADTTTPLIGHAPLETLPDPPAAAPVEKTDKKKPVVTLSATVEHRGRLITITVADVTVDRFCDLLDASQYANPAPQLLAAPITTADDLPDGYKLCRKHGAPMKPRSRQGDTWNSHNVGTADKPCWCKGYAGPDSPGYEVGS